MRALIISANGFEDCELLCPMYRLKEEDIQVDVAAPEWGEITGKKGYKVAANLSFDDVQSEGYKLLLIPGGKAPSEIRSIPKVQDIVKDFFEDGRPIAAICHGPQVLISAGVIQGHKATGYKAIEGELRAAGVEYVDEEVVIDKNLITSRQPSDIPAFNREIIKAIKA